MTATTTTETQGAPKALHQLTSEELFNLYVLHNSPDAAAAQQIIDLRAAAIGNTKTSQPFRYRSDRQLFLTTEQFRGRHLLGPTFQALTTFPNAVIQIFEQAATAPPEKIPELAAIADQMIQSDREQFAEIEHAAAELRALMKATTQQIIEAAESTLRQEDPPNKKLNKIDYEPYSFQITRQEVLQTITDRHHRILKTVLQVMLAPLVLLPANTLAAILPTPQLARLAGQTLDRQDTALFWRPNRNIPPNLERAYFVRKGPPANLGLEDTSQVECRIRKTPITIKAKFQAILSAFGILA